MITLSTDELFEIGETISKKLVKNNVSETATLTINVDGESFRKIDEDVFYTFKKNGVIDDEAKFEPSKKKISLSFRNLNILIHNNS